MCSSYKKDSTGDDYNNMIRYVSESLFSGEPAFFSKIYSDGKAHWMLPRAYRSMTNYGTVEGLKSFEKYLVNNRRTPEIALKIRDYLEDKGVMLEPIDRKTKKIISHRDIKSNPGTIRTLIAQFKALGFLYEDRKKIYHFTEVAQEILSLNYDCSKKSDNKKIDIIMTNLICRINFNSEYFHGSQVRISWKFRLKPVLFILKILKSKRLSFYLEPPEMYILYFKAMVIEDYDMIVNTILEFRKIPDLPRLLGLTMKEYREIRKKFKDLSYIQLLISRKILKKEGGVIQTF